VASILSVIDTSEAPPTSKAPPIYHVALPNVSVCVLGEEWHWHGIYTERG